MEQWLTDNWLQASTLIALVVLIWKGSRWTGILETKVSNLEGWMKAHIEHHPGPSK